MATVAVRDAIAAQAVAFACCRCRQPIVPDAIAGTWETWVTATEGDPWCEGLAHLPRPITR